MVRDIIYIEVFIYLDVLVGIFILYLFVYNNY